MKKVIILILLKGLELNFLQIFLKKLDENDIFLLL